MNEKIKILKNKSLFNEEKISLIKARINQSKFRNALIKELNILKYDSPIRDINKHELLDSSHIKSIFLLIRNLENNILKKISNHILKKLNINNNIVLNPRFLNESRNSFLKKEIICTDLFNFIFL